MKTKDRDISKTELSAIFHRMANCYRMLGPEQRFRAIAYDNAARTVNSIKANIRDLAGSDGQHEHFKGIGESISEKIEEYLATGHIKTYDQLRKKIPDGFLDLLEIPGMGPSTIQLLRKNFGISNREELSAAIAKGTIRSIRGFGTKKLDNIRKGLSLFKQGQARMLLPEASAIGGNLINAIRKIRGVDQAELAGSLRRMKETIGDIDIIVCAETKLGKSISDQILKLPEAGRKLAGGETKASFLLRENQKQVDVRLVDESSFGAALLYFTGSKEHSIRLRSMAKSRGWKLNEYGIFDLASDKQLAGKTEQEIYRQLGMTYIPPEMREERGEIELALKNKLPKLVSVGDIRGDLHLHSTWSDGNATIEEIAKYVIRNYSNYEYLVLSDHSPSERIAGGLKPEEFVKQFREIDRVNKKSGKDLIKKGAEVDILSDGTLDLPDELLAQFDWITASIHSGLSNDNTDRLLRACEHPLVHCIGHPSGRLIGKRNGYEVNWEELFRKARETGTAIEINGQPERLDLRDDLVKAAIEQGVTLTVSTDAHSFEQFSYMDTGIAVARRGWCTKNHILNTQPWKSLAAFAAKKAGRKK